MQSFSLNMSTSFPTKLDDISVEWLNLVFLEKKVIQAERITGFHAEAVEKQGSTSMVYILTLSYDRAPDQAPNRIIAKLGLDNQAIKDAVNGLKGFQREVNFYEKFADDPGIPVPRCYASGYNPDDHSFMLLLDYIDHTRATDIGTGAVADIDLAVEHLAAFHGKWWNREHDLKGVYYENGSFILETLIKQVSDALDIMRDRHRDDVGQTVISILDLWLSHAHILADYAREGPLTLCHSDFHRQQILSPITEGDPFCVLDWQSVSIDCGPSDLARLMIVGLLPEQRKKHEGALLKKYHALLLENGVADYSYENFMNDYRLGLAKQIILHSRVFAGIDIQHTLDWWETMGPKGISMWDMLYKWPGQSAEDHDVIAFLDQVVQMEKNKEEQDPKCR